MNIARGRRRRLRRAAAPRRRRVEAAARAAIVATPTDPAAPPPVADVRRAADALAGLARDLRGSTAGDAKVAAAARGVGELAAAYDLMARAAAVEDPQRGMELVTRSVAALDRADREQRRAGDAWPL